MLTVVGILAFLAVRPARKRTPQRKHSAARPAPQRAPFGSPVTTQKAACDLLQELLASRSAYIRRISAADMRNEMREHADELRNNIERLAEEIAKQADYRAAIAEDLADQTEGDATAAADDEATARAKRHLAHLDREIGEMKAQLAADRQALREFRTDRTSWVRAYARHCLEDAPNPNQSRSRHTA